MGSFFSTEAAKIESYYGWKKDESDDRDEVRIFAVNNSDIIKKVDLRDGMPEVYDQGKVGSCTANAIAAAYQYDEIKQLESKDNQFTPSRLFIYYNERVMEGAESKDGGAAIRDGIKSINKTGVCREVLWPYDVSKCLIKPTPDCYEDAKKHHSVQYKKVMQTMNDIKACLISGFPIVFGFVVYESFEGPNVKTTGVMPMPKKDEKILGGHAVVLCGFDEDKKSFLVRNSWGNTWGDHGYFWMPYDYLLNQDYCSDFWTVQKIIDNLFD